MLRVRLLGQFEVRRDDTPLVIQSRAAQALFAFLLLNSGVSHRREKLAGLFWPEFPEESARNNLRRELWRLRKVLQAERHLKSDDFSITFDATSDYWLDTVILELGGGEKATWQEWIDTLSVYRGELLPGFYDEWIVLERERLLAIFEHKMALLLSSLEQAGRWEETREWGERWIALGHSPEPAFRALMVAHAQAGDHSQVAAVYQRCVDALRADLGVEPSDQTRRLFEQLVLRKSAGTQTLAPQPSFTQAGPASAEPPGPGEPPFQGLAFFDAADADRFFGRERLIEQLLALLCEHTLLVVVGASGSGKSSLLRAGLIPALKHWQRLCGETDGWRAHLLTPTAHPLHALAVALTREAESVTAAGTLADDLERDPRSLAFALARLTSDEVSPPLLLVVDQFEELFTLCRDDAEREAFVDNLMAAIPPAGSSKTRIVLALRADFYAHCAQYPELREALAQRQEYIGPMTAEEMRRAIEGPAQHGGWNLEPGLGDLILRDVGDEPGALPLLSHALLETWQRRQGRTLTLAGYNAAGGVCGAIAKTAESVFAKLSSDQQAMARNIFFALTELGEGTQDTRRRATFEELVPPNGDAAATREVLNTLAQARLLTLGENTAEVAHEALIREWPALREWLNHGREGLRLHRRLGEAAQAWQKANRDEGELYRGARLAQALEWARGRSSKLTAPEFAFLDASKERQGREEAEREAGRQRELEAAQKLAQVERQQAEAERERVLAVTARAEEQGRANRTLRQRAVLLAGALFVAALLALMAGIFGQRSHWNAERAQAEQRVAFTRELSVNAVSNLDIDPERSILLALQAVSISTSGGRPVMREAEEALHRAVNASRVQMTLRGHTDGVSSVAFSPDGKRIATGSYDKTVRMWDATTGKELLTFPSEQSQILGVAFSPDGTRLAIDTMGGRAVIRDLASGRESLNLPNQHEVVDALHAIAFSPDGKRVLTAGRDNTAVAWDGLTGEKLFALSGHTGRILGVTFSHDGKLISTASYDKTAKVWDAGTGKVLLTMAGHASAVYEVAFSPDDRRLVTGGGDSIAKVWDAESGRELLSLMGHTSRVHAAGFSPDGSRIVTGCLDGTAKVWDAATGQSLLTLAGHTGGVRGVSFNPDGTRLATASADLIAKVWDVSPAGSREWLTVAGFTNHILGMGLDPDGKRLAVTAGHDNSIRLLDAATGKQLLSFAGHIDEPLDLIFSPDGTRLATGSFDKTVRVWDAATGRQLLSIPALDARPLIIFSLSFSPDGSRLAAPTGGNTAKVWDAATGQEQLTLAGHTGAVYGTAFSPDGKRIATTSSDSTAKIWDAVTGQQMLTVSGHKGTVWDLAFSWDGRRLATSGNDGTARVWDTTSGKELLTLAGHATIVRGVAFSPDNLRLASASGDATIKLWDVSPTATRKEQPLTLYGHPSATLRVAFSPDGRRLATVSEYGMVRIYALPLEDIVAMAKSRLTRKLTQDECRKYLHGEECPAQ